MEWTGLDKWLESRGNGRVTKQEIDEYLQQNQLELKEIVRRDPANAEMDTLMEIVSDRARRETKEKSGVDPGPAVGYEIARQAEVGNVSDEMKAWPEIQNLIKARGGGEPKFASPAWQTSGGTNYREVLLQKPQTPAPEHNVPNYATWARERGMSRQEIDSTWRTEDPRYKEWERATLDAVRASTEHSRGRFKEGHYPEPDVIAHMRLKDREGPNGEKILFVEEMQSDWGKKRKEKGDEIPRGPFVESPGDWIELVNKRLLRMAVEEGYDSIQWTTGKMQQERYDLRKQVSSIDYFPDYNRLEARDLSGDLVLNKDVTPEQLPEYLGKGVTERLLQQPIRRIEEGTDHGGHHQLTGENLKVGGEFQERIYDQMIPQSMAKLTKKMGGQIGQGAIGKSASDAEPVHSLTITPEMRTQIQGGLPLFGRRTDPRLHEMFGLPGEQVQELMRGR
jgi:hypothetical protein